MKNYETFKNELKDLVAEEVENRGIEGISFKFDTINSPDGMTDRLIVSVGESKMSMAFRLKEMYSDYENTEDLDRIAERTANTIEENLSVIKEKEHTVKDFITDYEQVQSSTYLRLVPGNSPVLKDAPHKEIGDMAVVVSINLAAMSDANGRSCVVVTNPLMEMYGLEKEQLFADAEVNASKNEIVFTPLGDMIRHLIDAEDLPDPEDVGITTYIATTPDGFQGAAVLAYPGFAEKACDTLGGDFWLIPSSVHEWILIKDDGNAKAKDLNSMIRNVNETVLEPRDYLSDQCYHFDSITKTLTTGLDYEIGVKTSLYDFTSKQEPAVETDNDINDDIDI